MGVQCVFDVAHNDDDDEGVNDIMENYNQLNNGSERFLQHVHNNNNDDNIKTGMVLKVRTDTSDGRFFFISRQQQQQHYFLFFSV